MCECEKTRSCRRPADCDAVSTGNPLMLAGECEPGPLELRRGRRRRNFGLEARSKGSAKTGAHHTNKGQVLRTVLILKVHRLLCQYCADRPAPLRVDLIFVLVGLCEKARVVPRRDAHALPNLSPGHATDTTWPLFNAQAVLAVYSGSSSKACESVTRIPMPTG